MTKINNTISKKILREKARTRGMNKKKFFKKITKEQEERLASEQEQLFLKALIKMKLNLYIKSKQSKRIDVGYEKVVLYPNKQNKLKNINYGKFKRIRNIVRTC